MLDDSGADHMRDGDGDRIRHVVFLRIHFIFSSFRCGNGCREQRLWMCHMHYATDCVTGAVRCYGWFRVCSINSVLISCDIICRLNNRLRAIKMI